jgi:hypothetical protein
MKLASALTAAVISSAAFFANLPEPITGIQPASAQSAKNIRVRIDFRTLYCKNTTGDEPSKDEPYVKYLQAVPGSPSTLRSIAKTRVGAGDYVWDGDQRKVLWEGELKPGQAALFIVNVMEDDGSPPSWQDWVGNSVKCGAAAASAAATGGATAGTVLDCAGLAETIIRQLNGDDQLGQFTVTVKNDNGVLKKTLHTAGARSQIGGYGEPAVSDSGKTIRMRLGQGTSHPQRYQASLQIRQITDRAADASGDALTWTVTGRDDAK